MGESNVPIDCMSVAMHHRAASRHLGVVQRCLRV